MENLSIIFIGNFSIEFIGMLFGALILFLVLQRFVLNLDGLHKTMKENNRLLKEILEKTKS
jgi:hypothetical protein